jgi:hypothetical protein
MEDPGSSCTEILARLQPSLERIFAAYRISEERAREIMERSCFLLISKRPMRQDPEGWLLRMIIDKCQESREEAALEDSSE